MFMIRVLYLLKESDIDNYSCSEEFVRVKCDYWRIVVSHRHTVYSKKYSLTQGKGSEQSNNCIPLTLNEIHFNGALIH